MQADSQLVDQCTVYVEQLSLDADHEQVRALFAPLGEVTYISVPKFKSGSSKGFAFVEFRSPETVEKVLKEFPNVEITQSPANLASILTFNEETKEGSKSAKRKLGGDTTKSVKRVKIEEAEEVRGEEVAAEVGRGSGQGGTQDTRHGELRVLSKIQWKKLRNQYLNEQRKNFSRMKQSLRRNKQKLDEKGRKEESETGPGGGEITGKTEVEAPVKNDTIAAGVIVRLAGPEGGLDNMQQLKQRLRAGLGGESVAYVDGRVGAEQVWVRCNTPAQAARLVQADIGPGWGGAIILTGEAEKEYHAKIEKDKQDKRSGAVQIKKPKKKSKILLKTESARNAHTFFD